MSEEEISEEQQRELEKALDEGGAILYIEQREGEDDHCIILPADICRKLVAIAQREHSDIGAVIIQAIEREANRARRRTT